MSAHITKSSDVQKHTISLHVANRPGVLIRIALVFARRGYNIDSLVVSPASNPNYSMMNITAVGENTTLTQILKQLNKLVDVVHATDRTGEDILQKELALIKLNCTQQDRSEILQLAHAMRCDIVDISEQVVMLQATGSSEEVDNVTRVLGVYDVIEIIRTGKVLMARGAEHTA